MILKTALALALATAFQTTPTPSPAPAPAPEAKPTPDGPVLDLETSMGTIRVGLFATKAPLSTRNIMNYVRSGHYNGTVFHRVIPGFMVQGGGLDAKLVEKPTQAPVRNEARNGLTNVRGSLALARTSDPHSATSQFFINVKDNAGLDFGISRDGWGYAVFGEVLSGMEVVDAIVNVPTTSSGPHQNVPIKPVSITRVKIVSEPAPAAPATSPKPQTTGAPRTRGGAERVTPAAKPKASASPAPQ